MQWVLEWGADWIGWWVQVLLSVRFERLLFLKGNDEMVCGELIEKLEPIN